MYCLKLSKNSSIAEAAQNEESDLWNLILDCNIFVSFYDAYSWISI